ncbi:MAG: tetraacyldisaccharide 4'-kinase [Bacterioplanes sp.]|nr:tetraacyldisaccharide 4'-kinase [Bacterioplanes sp.]
MLSRLAQSVERNWYQPAWRNAWLLPLIPLVALVVNIKRWRHQRSPASPLAVPVLVVGNITVGGTGKTPFMTYLVAQIQARGLRVGIVSRGYGGKSAQYPLWVTSETPVDECGDEPKLLQQRLLCPVVVDPQRARAAQALIGHVDIILSDDGLQHYALTRQAEVVVIDAGRGFGNGWLLPVGPLREPVSRLQQADLCLRNGDDFHVQALSLLNVASGLQRPLTDLSGLTVHAVAGIGHPERFFKTLRDLGAHVIPHPFPDHYAYQMHDVQFDDEHLIVMTEKDWVKCHEFADERHWYLTIGVVLDEQAERHISDLLNRVLSHSVTVNKEEKNHG